MKAIKCLLVCYTAWGSTCLHQVCQSKREARESAREMIDEGFAFSYTIKKLP